MTSSVPKQGLQGGGYKTFSPVQNGASGKEGEDTAPEKRKIKKRTWLERYRAQVTLKRNEFMGFTAKKGHEKGPPVKRRTAPAITDATLKRPVMRQDD